MTPQCLPEFHEANGGACAFCCNKCNFETHRCHYCGTELRHDSYEFAKGGKGERHWLSDCRPDLVRHEPGGKCTWAYRRGSEEFANENENTFCYAYRNPDTNEVGLEHKYFYGDGPMT